MYVFVPIRREKCATSFIRAKRVSNCHIQEKKICPSVCVDVRLMLVLVWKTLILVLVWGTYYVPATYVPDISLGHQSRRIFVSMVVIGLATSVSSSEQQVERLYMILSFRPSAGSWLGAVSSGRQVVHQSRRIFVGRKVSSAAAVASQSSQSATCQLCERSSVLG